LVIRLALGGWGRLHVRLPALVSAAVKTIALPVISLRKLISRSVALHISIAPDVAVEAGWVGGREVGEAGRGVGLARPGDVAAARVASAD
jgi:hypothetical protein